MSFSRRIKFARFVSLIAVVALTGWSAQAQAPVQTQPGAPVNDLPNPYQTIENFFKMPEGRTWGSTSAVEIDRDGRSIWVAERCAQNSCLVDRATGQMSNLPTVLKFDSTGKLVASFGQGMLIFPHGITVDREGNVWVTDGQDNAPATQRGGGGRGGATAAGTGAATGVARGERGGGGQRGGGGRGGDPGPLVAPRPGATKGHQIFKFSPDGRLLLTLGKPGGATGQDFFYQPNDVLVAPNGDIFVCEGHSDAANANARILKFNKDGKFIKSFGKKGSGPGELAQPHALAMDSRGRLFVGDRSNNRISIFDQEGNFQEMWYQFGRPSGVAIDQNDMIYVADSESGSVEPEHGAWKRGIRIGSARTGQVTAFIPDPVADPRATYSSSTSAAEGVAVDPQGVVYGAEVGPRALKKYVKR